MRDTVFPVYFLRRCLFWWARTLRLQPIHFTSRCGKPSLILGTYRPVLRMRLSLSDRTLLFSSARSSDFLSSLPHDRHVALTPAIQWLYLPFPRGF
ncbi:hypothetical protein BJY00DRAFT_297112 [Aspergillus carlsbadensis]|nr:hypothetical protein BJY00DRAFT_297112 [Aspergillus carlsbadensis]